MNTATGELLDTGAAERRAMKISLRLDTIAENYEAVMPMIREAIELRDDLALGYRSIGDYVSDRFGQALSKLGVELRREVVRELTDAGMSSRAIAPVVGVSHMTVKADRDSVVKSFTPETHQTPEGGEVPTHPQRAATPVSGTATPRPPVTGIDGKTYAPPAFRATPRKPLPDVAANAGWDLRKAVERLQRIAADDRFAANKEQVASQLRSHLTHAVEVCQDLLDRINT